MESVRPWKNVLVLSRGGWLAGARDDPRGARPARARRACAKPSSAGTPLSEPAAPNELCCCGFKRGFRPGDGRLCDPPTVPDRASRSILMVEALEGTAEARVFPAFHRLFQECGRRSRSVSTTGLRPLPARGPVATARHRVWLVSFMHHDLGYTDPEDGKLQTIDPRFGSRVSPM